MEKERLWEKGENAVGCEKVYAFVDQELQDGDRAEIARNRRKGRAVREDSRSTRGKVAQDVIPRLVERLDGREIVAGNRGVH
jgi:hypothetical protein